MKKYFLILIAIISLITVNPSLEVSAMVNKSICKNEKSSQKLEEHILGFKDLVKEYQDSTDIDNLEELKKEVNKKKKDLRSIRVNKSAKEIIKNMKKIYNNIEYAIKTKIKHIEEIEELNLEKECDKTITEQEEKFNEEENERLDSNILRIENVAYSALDIGNEMKWKRSWDDIELGCHIECVDKEAPITKGYDVLIATENSVTFNINDDIYREVRNNSKIELSDDEVKQIVFDKYYLSEEEMNEFILKNYFLGDCKLVNSKKYFNERHRSNGSDTEISSYIFTSESIDMTYKIEYSYYYDSQGKLAEHYRYVNISKHIEKIESY